MPHHLINTQKDIDDTCRRLAGETVIGVDTEFLRVRTYYPKLALVQISSEDAIYCIDPLVKGVELGALWSLLADPGVQKVIHAARQDVEVLLHTAGIMPRPLFDTQIAAALVGYGDQVGYAGLVEAEFGVSLPKSSQRTDWTRRPLSEAQLGYAGNDVRYLLPLRERLTAGLKDRDRYEWALEDFERDLDPDLYVPDPEQAYRRVGRGTHLDAGAQHALKRLCTWRENAARDRDLPRSWVLDDVAAAAIAAGRPESVRELERIEGVRSDTVRRDGDAIVACLREPEGVGNLLWSRHEPLTPGQKSTKGALIEVLKVRAGELGIAQSVLVTRADLDKLVRGVSVRELITGWRLEVIGPDLQRVLDDRMREPSSANAGVS
jgi:ribonuclease D